MTLVLLKLRDFFDEIELTIDSESRKTCGL